MKYKEIIFSDSQIITKRSKIELKNIISFIQLFQKISAIEYDVLWMVEVV